MQQTFLSLHGSMLPCHSRLRRPRHHTCRPGYTGRLAARSRQPVFHAQASSGRERASAGRASSAGLDAPKRSDAKPPAPTAAHAYASAIPFPGQASSRPAAAPAAPAARQQPPARAPAATTAPAAVRPNHRQQQQQQRQPIQHESAYTFMAPNWDPLVGRSRQHMRVEKDVLKASGCAAPLVVSGDVGLNTLRVAATVHALGLTQEDVSHPWVVVDCSSVSGVDAAMQLLHGGADGLMHGTDSSKSSVDVANDALLLSALTDGTLVLNNAHKAPAKLLILTDAAIGALLRKSKSEEAAAAEQPGSFLQAHKTRLVLVSQVPLAQLLQDAAGLLAPAQLQGGADGSPGPTAAAAAAGASGLKDCPSIALPALRARSSDIGPLAVAAGQVTAALRGYDSVELTDAAEKQLTSYDFPGNEAELKGLVQRAIMLHPPAPTAAATAAAGCSSSSGSGSGSCDSPGCSCEGSNSSVDSCCGGCGSTSSASVLTLDAGDFWAATGSADRARVDVLEVLPWLRKYILNTGLWPVGLNRVTQFLYPLILASLFLGPQDRESSVSLTLFWAGWWPLVMLSFPFVGRAWCAMCPFMITGEAAQDLVGDEDGSRQAPAPAAAAAAPQPAGVLSVAAATASAAGRKVQKLSGAAAGMMPQGWQLQKWPSEAIEPWAGWFVIAAFAGILMWEQVWDLLGHAALSGWLLVLITTGAVACSVIWEKRLWCRFLCPIGAMNGLFAKLSMTEIRSRPGLCAAAACTKPCHKGRVDHLTLEVPCPSPDSGGTPAPAPSLISSLLPWSWSTGGSSSCSGDSTCGTCGTALASSPCCSSGPAPAQDPAVPAGAGFSCSAFIDAGSTAALDGGVGPTGSASAVAGRAAGSVIVEQHVVLPGCPMNMYPGKNHDNSQCIMCGNCLRSCTSGSAQWRLRPPAADLWGNHEASWAELHLMNVLLGSVLLHRLPEVCAQLNLPAEQLMGDKGPHLLLCAALLAAPSALTWAFHKGAAVAMERLADRTAAARQGPAAVLAGQAGLQRGRDVQDSHGQPGVSWLRLSYSVLPLVWAGAFSLSVVTPLCSRKRCLPF